ncbi:MAG TPA: hypothetical protein VMH32_14700 [Burkholderiales bacterium]|nr:hypothetical protein [Burkholderiales bacterium]
MRKTETLMRVDQLQLTGVCAGTTATDPGLSSRSTRSPALVRTVRPLVRLTKIRCSLP